MDIDFNLKVSTAEVVFVLERVLVSQLILFDSKNPFHSLDN